MPAVLTPNDPQSASAGSSATPQTGLSLATLADGGFVAVWAGRFSVTDHDIFMRRYDASGLPVGGSAVVVNAFTTGMQTSPTVAGLDDGGWVVAWTSVGQDGSGSGVFSQRYNAQGQALSASDTQVNVFTTDGQFSPSIAANSRGGYAISWTSNGQDGNGNGVYARMYGADGTVVNAADRLINTTTAGNQNQPTIAALPGSKAYVVAWTEPNDGSSSGIRARVWNEDQSFATAQLNVNATTQSAQDLPKVAGLADGSFVVVWSSLDQDGSLYGVYGRKFSATGTALTGEFRVNVATASTQTQADVKAMSDGGFVVTWQSAASGNFDTFARRFDAAGTAVDDTEIALNVVTTGGQTNAVVAALPFNDFATAFFDNFGGPSVVVRSFFNHAPLATDRFPAEPQTLLARYAHTFTLPADPFVDREGSVLAYAATLANGSPLSDIGLSFDPQTLTLSGRPTLAAVGNQTVRITASDPDGHTGSADLVLRVLAYVPQVYTAGADQKVYSADTSYAVPARIGSLEGGGYAIATMLPGEGNGDIFVSRFDASGQPVGSGPERANAVATGSQARPDIAGLTGGGYAAVWSSDSQNAGSPDIYARGFDASGAASTGDVEVTGVLPASDSEAAVAPTADGGYLVVWKRTVSSTAFPDIVARGFSASGQPDALGLRSIGFTTGSQSEQAVTALKDGGHVITFSSNVRPTDNLQRSSMVFGARYDASGQAVGDVFWVSTLAANQANLAQTSSSVAALEDGGFVVVWVTANSASNSVRGTDILMQQFDANGVARFGSPVVVNAFTTGNQDAPVVTALSGGGFAVAWQSAGQDGSGTGIFAQAFDAQGRPAALDDLPVNAYTVGSQTLPDIGALGDGGFVVTWRGLESGQNHVYRREFRPLEQDAPVLNAPLADQQAPPDRAFSFTPAEGSFSDATPGDSLVFSAQRLDPAAPGAPIALPGWLSLDDITGRLSGTPGVADIGSFDVVLTATDRYGASVSDRFTLTVLPLNRAPTAYNPGTLHVDEDGSVVFSTAALLAASSDPDGDALSLVSFALDGIGRLADQGDGTWRYDPPADASGTVNLTLTVSDGQEQASSSFSLVIDPVNDAPTTVPVVLAPVDEDSGPLTITQAMLLALAGDVDTPVASLSASDLQLSGSGELVANPDGSWRFTPASDDDGGVALSYTVSDGSATASGSATLDLLPINDAPTTEQVVLAAVDEDSGPLTITQAMLLAQAHDVDSARPQATQLAMTGKGTLVDQGDGSWVYTPAPDDDSGVRFSYTIGDGSLTVAGSATLDLLPVNDAPVTTDDNAETARNTGVNIAVLANDRDIDGGPLTVAATTPGVHGSVAIRSDGLGVRYTPNAGFSGRDQFTYTASDGAGGSTSATVRVVVASQAGGAGADVALGTPQADFVLAGDGDDRVLSYGGDDHVDGGRGADTLSGGPGADTLIGGEGNDLFLTTAAELASDSIEGGDGIDTLQITDGIALMPAAFVLLGVEQLSFPGALQVAHTAGLDLSALTLSGLGNQIMGGTAASRIIGTRSHDRIIDSAGNDDLRGADGNDTIMAGVGQDTIHGGRGNDTLGGSSSTLGDGAIDTFVFNTALNAATNVDTVIGFEANGRDLIALDSSIFSAIGAALEAGEFRSAIGGLAADADDFILFDPATGALYYDADGSGAVARIQFATLGAGLTGTVDLADFVLGAFPG